MIKLSFDLFGYHVGGFRIDLDMPERKPAPAPTKLLKKFTRLWVKGMTS